MGEMSHIPALNTMMVIARDDKLIGLKILNSFGLGHRQTCY